MISPVDPGRAPDFRVLMDHLAAGVVVHAPSGEVVYVNPAACRLTGLECADMLARALDDPVWRLFRADGSLMPVAEYPARRVLATMQPLHNQLVGAQHPITGVMAWVLCSAYLEHEADGTLRHVVMMLLDVTDRVQGERELAWSESRFRLLYEHGNDGVLLTHPDGSVESANPAACRLFGLSEAELIARGRQGLVDEADPRLAQLLRERDATGRALGRLRMRRGDGVLFEAEVSSALYRDADGQSCASIIVRDASMREEAEAAQAARIAAERASEAKNTFIGRLSHELRTPLNAILGMTQVLRAEAAQRLTPAMLERLGHVAEAGRHLLRLIEDLLDLSLIEAGRLRVSLQPVALAALVREVLVQLQQLAAGRALAVTMHDEAQDAWVLADAGRLRQVLWNLLSNAVKYNRERGSIEVTLQCQGDCAIVAVRDSGMGMDESQLARLFQPFERLGREESRVPGAGIGLTLSRHLVQAMGGRIGAQARPGQGSEFRVELPRCAPPLPVAREASDTAAEAEMSTVGAAARTLVYVDDDAVNRLVLRGMVELQPGWRLLDAEDGEQALALVRSSRPDAVLVDMVMPGMDGPAVLQALRADEATCAIPCIAVTALAAPQDEARARAAGFDGYITKPLERERLLAELRRVLDPGPGPAA